MLNFTASTVKASLSAGTLNGWAGDLALYIQYRVSRWDKTPSTQIRKLQSSICGAVNLLTSCSYMSSRYQGLPAVVQKVCVGGLQKSLEIHAEVVVVAPGPLGSWQSKVCMYVCVCIFVCICMCVCMYIYVYYILHIQILCICVCVCVCTYIFLCMYVCM